LHRQLSGLWFFLLQQKQTWALYLSPCFVHRYGAPWSTFWCHLQIKSSLPPSPCSGTRTMLSHWSSFSLSQLCLETVRSLSITKLPKST
jgi:hypothetical protein